MSARCRCCGIAVEGQIRERVRVCMGCDDCDGLHGDKLQGILAMAVRDGKLAPYTALARLLIDDAQMTGRTVWRETSPGRADLTIPDPPPPWLIICGRALARGEVPDIKGVVDAVLLRYIPGRATPSALASLRRDLSDALRFIDPDIMDVYVTATMDELEPGNLRIEIKAKTPTIGTVVTPSSGPAVEIPADILSRPRGSA
jgi:hypothetical protein